MAAQLEDGYTPIAHEILEALSRIRINGTQANIILFIMRYTYGFHRKSHELGNAFIAEGTGIRKDQIKREINKLIEMKIIKVFEESTYSRARIIGINTKTSEWVSNTKSTQGTKKTPGGELPPTLGTDYPPPPGGYLPPQEIYSFKNNFKDISTTTGERLADVCMEVFGPIVMTGTMQGFFHNIRKKGYDESFCIELLREAAESCQSTKPSLRYLESIRDRWFREGITSRQQAKEKRMKVIGGGMNGKHAGVTEATRKAANRGAEKFVGTPGRDNGGRNVEELRKIASNFE